MMALMFCFLVLVTAMMFMKPTTSFTVVAPLWSKPATTTSAAAQSSRQEHSSSTFHSTRLYNTAETTNAPKETDTVATSPTTPNTDNDNDEEEWEYLEYEELQEQDFAGSEWLVGTNWDSSPHKIQETWVRCLMDDTNRGASSQPCIWGDGNRGTWTFDRASQYFSMSKEYLWGKTIWAGVVEDYYYLQGTVRGWTYVTPAEVLGQWQAKRLGVDPEEAGVAPWFEQDESDSEVSENKSEESLTTKSESLPVESKEEQMDETKPGEESKK